MISYCLSFLVVVLSALVWILLTENSGKDVSVSQPPTIHMPVRRDGVVFVTDGARGNVREASIELTKLGYHVLLGVKSEDERKTFAYDQRKGLETILFDIGDPVTLVNVIYRLRQIRRDLDRPIVGLVINLMDFMEDHLAEKDYVDLEILDINYKSLVKGPVRLFQAIFDAIRYKSIDDRNDYIEGVISDSGRMITANASTAISSARRKFDSIAPNSSINAMGLRIVTVTADMTNVSDRLICGSKCVMQENFINFIDSFRSDDTMVSNISLSTIYANFNEQLLNDEETFTMETVKINKTKTTRYATHPNYQRVKSRGTNAKKEEVYEKQLLIARLRSIKEYLNKMSSVVSQDKNKKEDSEEEFSHLKMSYTTKAILHALASPKPQLHYDENRKLSTDSEHATTTKHNSLWKLIK